MDILTRARELIAALERPATGPDRWFLVREALRALRAALAGGSLAGLSGRRLGAVQQAKNYFCAAGAFDDADALAEARYLLMALGGRPRAGSGR
jgi:hypothetical protein